MSDLPLAEIAQVPALRDRWVALDVRGIPRDRSPFQIALPSGIVVVDADPELGALCARLSHADRTSLQIVFASGS